MKNNAKLISIIAVTAMLTACTQQNGRPNTGVMQGGGINKQDAGTVIGGVVGGVLGSQVGGGSGKTVATIGGALLGATLGNSVGQSLDRADMEYYHRTSQTALETGQPGQAFPWNNPNSQASGVIVPGTIYETSNEQYCREYSQNITIGGQTERAYGTACRQADGTWEIVE